MNIQETREVLEKMGVHDLRKLGREWGVQSPTSRVKKDLIESILKIISGEEQTQLNISHRGRPIKEGNVFPSNDMQNIADNFKELHSLYSIKETDKLLFASCEEDIPLQREIPLCTKEGYLTEDLNKYYFADIYDNRIVFVPRNVVSQYNLQLGDRIIAQCLKRPDKSFCGFYYIATLIRQINDYEVDEGVCARKLAPISDVVVNNNNLVIDGITEGSLLVEETLLQYEYIFSKENLIKGFMDKNFHTIIALQNVCLSEKVYIEKMGIISVFAALRGDGKVYFFDALRNAVKHAKVLAREGKKILLLILEIDRFFAYINSFFEEQKLNQAKTFREQNLDDLLKEIASSNCVFSNGGSVTTIITARDKNFFKLHDVFN